MANYLTPGVYVNEISTFPASVAPVATGIPAFVGYTEKAIIEGVQWNYGSGPAPAQRVTSLLEFESIFGGPNKEDFAITITDSGAYPPATRTITAPFAPGSPSPFLLYYSMKMYFANGGGPCWIVAIGGYGSTIDDPTIITGIESLEKYDEPTLIVFPDAVKLSSVAEYAAVVDASLAHCAKMQDRFTITDVWGNTLTPGVANFRNAVSPDNLKYGASYMPFLNTLLNFGINETLSTITYPSPGTDPNLSTGMTLASLATNYPSVYNEIIAVINSTHLVVDLPPSGAIAGIYARVDRERGVWKAPANVGIRGLTATTINITNEQQETLNVDAGSGKSINAIRAFTGKGILVWGSRTLAGNDNEWRYVPVRRLFLFAEESIEKATEFVVFEPNTAVLWQKVKGMIESFLNGLWRDGALAGSTPEEAYFVNVGLGSTMTAQDILEGRLIIEVGMAAVRPAEFIILNFMHKLQES
ncbi:MAG TPA: phage tail sheath subtilisin-like domain-containing protein [Flavobacteriales bacterium]|nr:phage tail sheath subtilisin-like domain-containing protein [Flavobacteriales bacterium]